MNQLCCLFSRLKEANLAVNLMKSEFGYAKVTFLGHIMGQGQVTLVTAKIEAISRSPVLLTRGN